MMDLAGFEYSQKPQTMVYELVCEEL